MASPTNSQAPSTEVALSPLCVDLDGTLIHNDSMIEAATLLCLHNPFLAFAMVGWLLRGKPYLKEQISRRHKLDAEGLAYNQELLEFLRKEKESGTKLVLATGSHSSVAKRVADYLGIFDDVFATDEKTNLIGSKKADYLRDQFGDGQFSYAGNSNVDLKVWQHCKAGIAVNCQPTTLKRAQELTNIVGIFPPRQRGLSAMFKLMRPHQWLKNILVFVPLVAWGGLTHLDMLMSTVLAFLSFSLTASSVYVLNDLVDLHSDRKHESKRKRPLAAGTLELGFAPPLCAGLAGCGFLIGSFLPTSFLVVLLIYLCTTLLYSFFIKAVAITDVICLSLLYMVRIYAGAAAVEIDVSPWLLGFSVFLFLSLAMVKRVSELLPVFRSGSALAPGRGYRAEDVTVLQSLGTSSGYLSVVVLALYINLSEQATNYANPYMLWFVCLTLLYWISRVWLITGRGEMYSDPVVFAVKDPGSHLAGIVTLAILAAAWTLGLK